MTGKKPDKPGGASDQPAARPGRPKNSVSLTEKTFQTIVGLVQAGGLPKDAAGTAGIALRTYHEWIARGEDRHPTRPGSPKLRRFATAVRKAQSQARAIAMTEARTKDPKWWLRNAPTPPGHDPIGERRGGAGDSAASLEHLSDEDLLAEAARVGAALVSSGHLKVPPCESPRCRWAHHRTEHGGRRGARS